MDISSEMTDLHFDNKQVTIKCTRNHWRVNATIFIPDEVTTNMYYSSHTFENIYLPLTLERCLVLKNAVVAFIDPPYFKEWHDPLLQEIEFVGKDMEMITMDEYWNIKIGD